MSWHIRDWTSVNRKDFKRKDGSYCGRHNANKEMKKKCVHKNKNESNVLKNVQKYKSDLKSEASFFDNCMQNDPKYQNEDEV